jgi:hypothetical protein
MTFIHIRGPILMVQGKNGQCGAMQQAEVVQQECYYPALLPDTRQAPHSGSLEMTLRTTADFVTHVPREPEISRSQKL